MTSTCTNGAIKGFNSCVKSYPNPLMEATRHRDMQTTQNPPKEESAKLFVHVHSKPKPSIASNPAQEPSSMPFLASFTSSSDTSLSSASAFYQSLGFELDILPNPYTEEIVSPEYLHTSLDTPVLHSLNPQALTGKVAVL